MERPERPSRHSKSHDKDKWKRIIQPAGDSDSSSEWSTDSDPAIPYSHQHVGASPAVSASTSTATSGAAAISTESPSRERSRDQITVDYLVDRYNLGGSKRSLENGEASSSHNHLLHHDYAERDSFRGFSPHSTVFPWFLRPSSGQDRKRQRLLRLVSNELPGLEVPGEEDEPDVPTVNLPNVSVRTDLTVRTDLCSVTTATQHLLHNELSRYHQSSVSRYEDFVIARRREEVASTSTPTDTTAVTPEVFNTVCDPEEVPDTPAVTPPNVLTSEAQAKRVADHRYTTCDSSPLSLRWTTTTCGSRMSARPFINWRRRSEENPDVQVIAMALATPSASTSSKSQAPCLDEVIIVEDQQSNECPIVPMVPETISLVSIKEEDTLNQNLIGLLECPVCMEIMSPPIHQCRRGHLVCVNCRPKLPLCPTCRARLTDSRNLAMEKVADKLLYPCKNVQVGCLVQLRLRDKVDHEANCDFRTYRCSLPQCDWKGLKDDLYPHNIDKHEDKLLHGKEQVLLLHLGDLSTTTNQNWIVSTFGALFRVNFISVRGGPRVFETGSTRMQVYGCVQYIGPRKSAAQYKYTLESKQSTGKKECRSMRFTRTTHNDLVKCAVNYAAGDSFYLRGDTAELQSEYLTPGNLILPVHLSITRVE